MSQWSCTETKAQELRRRTLSRRQETAKTVREQRPQGGETGIETKLISNGRFSVGRGREW